MHLKTFFYFLLLFSVTVCAQNYSIEGFLEDENHDIVPYANIVLKNKENDSKLFGTTSNEDGFFKIEKLGLGNYVLDISYLGFDNYTVDINLNKNINLGKITLREKKEELNGVLVIAKRPTIKRLVDRLVFNVESSTLSNNNVIDVLKHTPNVLIYNNKITVKNSEPIVYINDRRVYLSSNDLLQLLEGTSATNIKSIEVITNPPAKYDAEGGAVINIISSKNIIAGYNGSFFGNYKQGYEFPKYSLGTSHFFKTKKFDAYINYNIGPRKDHREKDEFIQFFDPINQQADTRWESNSVEKKKSTDQNLNINLGYDFNENNRLALSSYILASPREQTKFDINSSTKVFGPNGVLDSIFNTRNKSVNELYNVAFSLDYTHKFKKVGEKLNINVHHTNYDFSNFQDVFTGYFLQNETISFRDNKFQTFSSQKIKLHTGQVDYELPNNDNSLFETGVKVSNIDSDNVIRQYNFENGIKFGDTENSDIFLYKETNYAAYASYSRDWNDWNLKFGLRAEYTNINGESLSANELNKTDYVKLFPSFYLLNRINDNNELYFRYNKRIFRPRYADLNPFKYFINDNSYKSGNPNLKPQIDNVFVLGYTYKKNYNFEAYYRFEKEPAIQIAFQDNDDNLLKYITTNIDNSISYGLDLSTSTQIKNRYQLNTYASVFYYENQFYALESNNELLTNNKWTLLFQLNNKFDMLKDRSLVLDVSYLYISPFAQGPRIISSRSGFDINLKKTIWNNKASLSLGLVDVFNNQNYNTSTKYLNQDILQINKFENRLFTFGFNYKFGNSRLKNNTKNINLEELERLNSSN